LPVGIFAVTDAKIVRWRRDNKIDTLIPELRHSVDAILAWQIELGHEINLAESREIVQRKSGERVLVLGSTGRWPVVRGSLPRTWGGLAAPLPGDRHSRVWVNSFNFI
jgi:hypothetical protein